MSSTRNYLPSVYKGISEFDEIVDTDDLVLTETDNTLSAFEDNQFVLTAREDGLIQYETDLRIRADVSTESAEFRKARVINRLSTKPPFTEQFLRDRLDEVIGSGKYTLLINRSTHTIILESSASNQQWFNEIIITMTGVKPANMIFINKPLSANNLNLNETVRYGMSVDNYRLGISWSLGRLPFRSYAEQGVIKMAETPSIQPELISDVATFTAGEIASVLINDNLKITTFDTKTASAGVIDLEYTVMAGSVSSITSIKLLKTDDTVLCASAVYVPVIQDVIIKHLINVQEGV